MYHWNWIKVVDLDMFNNSQVCPSPWREESEPARSCTSASCEMSVTFRAPTTSYSHVCGRVHGYAIGSTDAFKLYRRRPNLDSYYVDGVSLTHELPGTQIWTFASTNLNRISKCPCNYPPPNIKYRPPPSFVGENYFCEARDEPTYKRWY